jgi:hypothetical protein
VLGIGVVAAGGASFFIFQAKQAQSPSSPTTIPSCTTIGGVLICPTRGNVDVLPLPPSSLDVALKKLISGNIAFNTPDRIPLGQSRIIEAKLSTNLPPKDLLAQLSEAGAKESASIQVSDRMIARLDGGGAFDVSPSGAQQQLISKQEVTTWTWVVTPKQRGTQYLILSFDAVLTVDGKDGTRNINTFKRKIEINVPWPETLSEWFKLLKEWFENISWFWLTILVPIGVWLWSKLRKKPLSPHLTHKRITKPEDQPIFRRRRAKNSD